MDSRSVARGLALVLASCGGGDAPERPPESTPPAAGEAALEPGSPPEDEALPWLRPRARFDWPTERPHVTSRFGWRTNPISGAGAQLHRGIDLRGATGDYVLTIGAGVVEFAGRDPLLGRMVIVDHGDGIRSIYGHMHDVLVHEGLPLTRGAAIGLVGNTGRSQAPHLHLTLEVDGEPVDPLAWIS